MVQTMIAIDAASCSPADATRQSQTAVARARIRSLAKELPAARKNEARLQARVKKRR
jgi:hypothetical protein